MIVNVVLVGINIEMNSGTQALLDESGETFEKLNDMASDISAELNWTEKPQPQITILNYTGYITENNTIPLEIISYYDPQESNSLVKMAPLMPRERKRIVLQIYNSGRLPWIMPLMYLNLTAENTSKTFPFRFYEIVTPVDGMLVHINYAPTWYGYDIVGEPELQQYYQSEWPFPHVTNISYRHWNEYNKLDFPPGFKKDHVYYTHLFSFDEGLMWSNNDIWEAPYGFKFDEMIDKFGPFRIGTVNPEQTVEVHIDIFSVIEDYFDVKLEFRDKYEYPRYTYINDTWTIDWEKYNLEYETYKSKINTFTTGRLTVEFIGLNAKVDPIYFNLSAQFNV